ncbi:hypothetical protein [Actinomadura madurae]|uniref:hypothetical protein n=1 Tax=Actinomadura madurae TaxID=1993 RepID=UPI0020D211E6|nr:hypothetical protein [Actinomadura madurae]MCQ0012059.1 hypothetical protein [Actinomadura madurae]
MTTLRSAHRRSQRPAASPSPPPTTTPKPSSSPAAPSPGWWDSDGLYAWLNLDAVREHLPDAEITWLDDAVEQASQEAPDA